MDENQTDPQNNPEPIQILLIILGLIVALVGVIWFRLLFGSFCLEPDCLPQR
mgnify:CR=1 FL=1